MSPRGSQASAILRFLREVPPNMYCIILFCIVCKGACAAAMCHRSAGLDCQKADGGMQNGLMQHESGRGSQGMMRVCDHTDKKYLCPYGRLAVEPTRLCMVRPHVVRTPGSTLRPQAVVILSVCASARPLPLLPHAAGGKLDTSLGIEPLRELLRWALGTCS
jgi:hypothetical protein